MNAPLLPSSARPVADDMRAPILEMRDIHKSYGGVVALRGASLVVEQPGVVHTLIGQNGCGKSSMLSVLSGQIRPDAGEIRIDGRQVRFRDAADAVRHGIAMVSQETAVAEDLSVAENILMGRRLVRTRRGIDWSASRRRATEIMAHLGIDYDPAVVVRTLRPDQKQMVEIARAISLDTRILILDEPTSSLTENEVHELFVALRTLIVRDVSVLFVSHRLPEVFDVSSSVTVMRNGETADAGPTSQFTPDSLVATMIGHELEKVVIADVQRADRGECTSAVVTLQGVHSGDALRGIDLELHPGRIVGIAGLDGSGRSEVLEVVFGSRAVTAGSVVIDGEVSHHRSPRTSIAAGIGYVPPDRKLQGLVLPMSVTQNTVMVDTYAQHRWSTTKGRKERRLVSRMADTFAIRAASFEMPVRALSGGNQQKVLFAKWLASSPRVLLLDEPTRGVDVAAKVELHASLRRAAEEGLALLVTSSEIPELINLCDELLVMYRGEVVHRFSPTDMTEVAVATVAAGGQL